MSTAVAHALQRQQVLTDLLAQIGAWSVAKVLVEGLKRTGCDWRVENSLLRWSHKILTTCLTPETSWEMNREVSCLVPKKEMGSCAK